MSNTKRSSILKEELEVGTRVLVNNEQTGTIRYLGSTSFQTGKWVGVELDEPNGKNSGVVQGKRYFDCKNDHGMFVRPTNVKIIVSFQTLADKNIYEF
jgi:dynactin 1